ncbi:hypothetical protein [Rhodococcus maanshanensis]|uniref:Uncharacterized protein n=1 Tax=Rhodococcus maanshanensis TaxID=183556 RepID=A0A1H7PLZ9_9NOCA|nr:hypothetical protein [Rhodococcus maanshanensis]SEL36851.1 hypothetical protein SAMN05444583_10899 [Rhodococcus maanshanensis]
MTVSSIEPLDGDDENEGADLTVVPDEFGALVIGPDHVIERFESEWAESHGPGTIAVPANRTAAIAVEAGRAILKSQRSPYLARYVGGRQLWDQLSRPPAGTVVTYHKMTRSAKTGKILSNPQVMPTALVPGAGQVMLGLAALEMALDQMAARIDEHLDIIEDKVGDVLKLASAQRLGDVYGHQRILQRRVKELADGSALTDTDWSSIAALGADLEVGVERLRQHAIQLLAEIRVEDTADKRADQLRKAVDKGLLRETLGLLLVAQQSLYLWQKLRLERVRVAEPGYLSQTLESARNTLREHLDADHELASELRSVLDTHAVLRVSEVHRQLAGRTLTKYREPLVRSVDDFIAARNLQVDEWIGSDHARIRDAFLAARAQGAAAVNASRKQIAGGANRLARWVEPNSGVSEADSSDPSPNRSDGSEA